MHIHFIAIGGAIMHQLAIELQRNNYQISGSDDEIFEPARANLLAKDLLPRAEGWFPEKITKDLDGVILGMHAKADNPELIRAKELNIPIYSFPEYIYEFSKNKKRVVIAGSHGKTSTTSMVMHVLKDQKLDFDFLVGAKLEGFDRSVKLSDAPLIILEGDEYPASVLEPKPKIHYYHPHLAVLTGIAWDHINVFPTFENYLEQFDIFLKKMMQDATLIYCSTDINVVTLVENYADKLRELPYITPNYKINNGVVEVYTSDGVYELKIFGVHNLQNMEAARKVCNQLGVEDAEFYESITTFTGAAKRMELVYESETEVVYRDFAHAPSKLKASVAAARERYPDHNLIAVFELHTYSSLNRDFLSEYKNSLELADDAAVFYSRHALELKNLPDVNPRDIIISFNKEQLTVLNKKDDLQEWVLNQINLSPKPSCILMMSSGNFENLDFKTITTVL